MVIYKTAGIAYSVIIKLRAG